MSYLSLGVGDSEADDDFAPSFGGMSSNLGSLFGMSAQMDNRAGSNQSLTYTAPKPPKPEKPAVPEEKKTTSVSGVAVAVAISAYKYVGDQYQSQGKLGMALLCNYAEKDFKILMYVSKQQPVATAKIINTFQFNVQPNNYATFHDDQRQVWSILFSSADQLMNFAKQVCIAKYHSQSDYSVSLQDLISDESNSQSLATGDSVEVKYTGWLMHQDGTLGAVFDSNHKSDKTFRFKTGKGKVIKGWEEGMLGMKKGGKRFLIIPPTMAYGAKAVGNRVPSNSTLVFEVDVLRIKHQSIDTMPQSIQPSDSREDNGTTQDMRSANSLAAGSRSDLPQETIKERTASINEQLSGGGGVISANHGKASLVSRMAKVGQPMLPLKSTMQQQETLVDAQVVAPSTEIYHAPNRPDSRSTHSNSPGIAHQNMSAFMPQVDYQRGAYSPHTATPVQVPIMQPSMPANIISQSQVSAIPFHDLAKQGLHSSMIPPQFVSQGVDIFPAILAESQNSNYKLKSLIEKVDDVSEKINKLKSQDFYGSGYRQSSDLMDAAQISFNIQRIIQENDRVKKQIVERDELVQKQSDKIADLLKQNQKMAEESHEQMAKRNVSFNEHMGLTQEKTMKLEKDKMDLTSKLSEATAKICDLQLALANTTERASSLEKIAKSSVGQHENEMKIQQLEIELSSTKSHLKSAKTECAKLENRLQENSAAVLREKSQSDEVREKLEAEMKNLIKEMTILKSKHEEEISFTRNKIQNQQSDAMKSQESLEQNWKEKCKEAVARVSKAAEDKIKDIQNENDTMAKRLEIFQQKMAQIRDMYEAKCKSEENLREQLLELENINERYNKLRQQAISMKQQYEDKISELQVSSSDDAGDRIKSTMNQVFQDVRAKIKSDHEYPGDQVLSVILSVIKSATLNILQSEDSGDDETDEDEIDGGGESDDKESDADSTDDKGAESILPSPSEKKQDEKKNDDGESERIKGGVTEPNETDQVISASDSKSVPSDSATLDESANNDACLTGDKDSTEESTQKHEATAEKTSDMKDGETESAEVHNNNEPPAEMFQEKGEKEIDNESEKDDINESTKPSPPPLFDNEEEDDDLDWLS